MFCEENYALLKYDNKFEKFLKKCFKIVKQSNWVSTTQVKKNS